MHRPNDPVIVDYNKFYGGISNDEYISLLPGGCYDCMGVEIRKKTGELYLNNNKINEISLLVNEATAHPMGINQTYSGYIYGYSDNHNFYIWNQSGVVLKQDNVIDKCRIVNYYNYSLTVTAVTYTTLIITDRCINLYDATTVGSTILYNHFTFYNITDFRPILSYSNVLYFGDLNSISTLDSANNFTNNVLILNANETIIALTNIGNLIYIYTNDGLNSYLYYWNGVDTYPENKITFNREIIRGVKNFGNYDYIYSSEKVSNGENGINMIHIGNGFDRKCIVKSDYSDSPDGKFIFNISYNNCLCLGRKLLFIPSYGYIYGYGEWNPGLGETWCRDYIYGGHNMYFMDISSDYLYYGYNGKFGFKDLRAPATQHTYGILGYWISLTEKVERGIGILEKYFIKYKLGAGSSIKVYYSINDGSFTLLETLTTGNSKLLMLQGLEFEKIQWKFELIGMQTTTPIIYQFKWKYNVRNDF